MSKDISQLDKVLIDTIQKASNVSGEIYDGAKSVTAKSIDFAMQQAPDLIHQLLRYNFIESLIFFSIGIILFAGSIGFVIYSINKVIKKQWSDNYAPALIFMIFPIAFGFCTVITNLDWLKIWLAPKIYLIEYAAHLLK